MPVLEFVYYPITRYQGYFRELVDKINMFFQKKIQKAVEMSSPMTQRRLTFLTYLPYKNVRYGN